LSHNDFLYIDNEIALSTLCEQLAGASWLAIDTEFERENTYYPELCLLQISNRDVIAIIDPLSIQNIEPLYNLLYKNSITKVFHSARQDLEIFFHLKGSVPVPLFDTQLAATILGYDNSIGYANLVEKMLGKILDKAHTRTNWKRRPLKPEQLRYAADDVIYLGQIYEQLQVKLSGTEKMVMLQSELDKLTNPQMYLPAPETMWQKIREARYMSGTNLEVLKALTAWREITARIENLPRKWLLADRVLIDLARHLPTTGDDLARINGMEERVIKMHGATLLTIIRDPFQQEKSA